MVPRFCAAFPYDDFYLSEAAVLEAVRTRSQLNFTKLSTPSFFSRLSICPGVSVPWGGAVGGL